MSDDTTTKCDKLTAQAEDWPARAREVRIDSEWAYDEAGHMLVGIKALLKESADVFGPIVKKAHEAHKTAKSAQNRVEAPLKEAETVIKREMARYHAHLEALRQAEQRRLEAEARKLEEDARLAEAAELEAAGDVEAADAVLAAPIVTPSVQTSIAPPKVEGITKRTTWKARVEDPVALVRHIAEHPELIHLIKEWDSATLNRMARAQGQQLHLPGVVSYPDVSIAAA